jgi:predicted anti-sigma-YlaC factor YlaD
LNATALSCFVATRLLSDEHERVLTSEELALLERHLETCPACVECGLQFRALQRIVATWRDAC